MCAFVCLFVSAYTPVLFIHLRLRAHMTSIKVDNLRFTRIVIERPGKDNRDAITWLGSCMYGLGFAASPCGIHGVVVVVVVQMEANTSSNVYIFTTDPIVTIGTAVCQFSCSGGGGGLSGRPEGGGIGN